jgi:hypothetical protein
MIVNHTRVRFRCQLKYLIACISHEFSIVFLKRTVFNIPDLSEVITRLFQENDEEKIVELLRITFPKWAGRAQPLEYWKWKYLNNPQDVYIVVSTIGEKIVGVGHCIKMKVKIGNRVVISTYDDDYATNPVYRRMGVYKSITNYIDDIKKNIHADFCYWITSNPIVLSKVQIHQQVTFSKPYSHLVRIKNFDLHLKKYPVKNAIFKKIDFLINKTYYKFLSYLKKHDYTTYRDIKLINVNIFDERFETFWDNIANDYDYIFQRNREYMNWRFIKDPTKDYKIVAAVSDNEIIGYVVLEIDDDNGYLGGYLIELLSLRNRNDVNLALIKEAVRYFDSLEINCINLAIEGNSCQKLATFFGFINAPYFSETYIRFWGYTQYFYDNFVRLKNDMIYFSYADYL